MVVFTLLYGALAVVEVKLLLHYVRKGAEPIRGPQDPADRDEDATPRLRLLRRAEPWISPPSGSS